MAHQKYKIGVDEAGRGPWFGPVVAAAFCFNLKNIPSKSITGKLKDSKKLTEKKREEIYQTLVSLSTGENPQVYFGVGVVDNFYIDEYNIRQATREAMRRALVELLRKIESADVESVVIDGKDNFSFPELKKKPIYIIKGDAKVLEISAASIIAKVFRDKLVDTYATLYPHIGLENHKGYGTKIHIESLSDSGRVTGAHRVSYKPVKAVLETRPKLLLHVCCGPDATVPIMDLKKDFDITCFWYDPNIQPKTEYNKRLKAFKKVCEIEGVPFIEGEYDVNNFFERVRGLESLPERQERCTECYDLRLERSARLASELGIIYWTTTLNISPHKDVQKLFAIGDKYSSQKNLEFLKIAFRKNGGFQRSVEYTKKYDIYRQDYCGCAYSETFPGKEKPKGKKKKFVG